MPSLVASRWLSHAVFIHYRAATEVAKSREGGFHPAVGKYLFIPVAGHVKFTRRYRLQAVLKYARSHIKRG